MGKKAAAKKGKGKKRELGKKGKGKKGKKGRKLGKKGKKSKKGRKLGKKGKKSKKGKGKKGKGKKGRKLGKKGKKSKKGKKARRLGQVCDAVLYVASACMNGHNVPANVQGVVTSGITSALGAFRRRLGIYDQALNAGCTAAYNAAAGAAGVPPAVATCFRNDIVNACVAKIHELGGRRLAKCGKKCMKKKAAAKKGKGKKRELGKKGKGKGKKGKKSRKLGKKGKKAG